MWFAALGNYNKNPWFLSLVKKLLDGCEPVAEILGDPTLSGEKKLVKLRASLYNYDFTRIDSEWTRDIPGVQLVNSSTSSWIATLLRRPDVVWSRSFQRNYLPPIERGNPSLAQFLASHRYRDVCLHEQDRCLHTTSSFCHVASWIRRNNVHLIAVGILVLITLRNMRHTVRNYFVMRSEKHPDVQASELERKKKQ
jgi:hypothetical protein